MEPKTTKATKATKAPKPRKLPIPQVTVNVLGKNLSGQEAKELYYHLGNVLNLNHFTIGSGGAITSTNSHWFPNGDKT